MGQTDALWLRMSCRRESPELAVTQGLRPFVPSSERWVLRVTPGRDRTGTAEPPAAAPTAAHPPGTLPAQGWGSSRPIPVQTSCLHPIVCRDPPWWPITAGPALPHPPREVTRSCGGGGPESPHQPGSAASCPALSAVDPETPSVPSWHHQQPQAAPELIPTERWGN